MVRHIASHDIRSRTPRQRGASSSPPPSSLPIQTHPPRHALQLTGTVPLLCPLLHHRQDIILYRPIRLVRHHRALGQHQHAIRVPPRAGRVFGGDPVVCECRQEPGGVPVVFGGGGGEGVQLERGGE